jgi:hypothetical protein
MRYKDISRWMSDINNRITYTALRVESRKRFQSGKLKLQQILDKDRSD